MRKINLFIKNVLGISAETTLWAYVSSPVVRKQIITSLVAAAIIVGLLIYSSIEIKESAVISKESIFALLHRFGAIAWLLYIALLIVAVMSPIPDSIVILAGGFFFGPVIGTMLTVVGQGLGAGIDFLLARKLGRKFVLRKFPKSASLIDTYSKSLGWQTVFTLRLFPTLSFDVLSYVAGISSLSLRTYMLATVIGLVPLAIITTVLGHSVHIRSGSVALIAVLVGGACILTIYSFFHAIVLRKRKK